MCWMTVTPPYPSSWRPQCKRALGHALGESLGNLTKADKKKDVMQHPFLYGDWCIRGRSAYATSDVPVRGHHTLHPIMSYISAACPHPKLQAKLHGCYERIEAGMPQLDDRRGLEVWCTVPTHGYHKHCKDPEGTIKQASCCRQQSSSNIFLLGTVPL